MIIIFEPASKQERRRYYVEEWKFKDLPNFIRNDLNKREFGFDHLGRGPNDRYKVFNTDDNLRRFLRSRYPFAAYCSVAFYKKPRSRKEWIKSELIFDVDAKDIPIRTCNCDSVCEICLNEAKELVSILMDTLKTDLGLRKIFIIYSGRGYHIRILDDDVMGFDSELRSQVLKYVVGADLPENKYILKNEERLEYYEQELNSKKRTPENTMEHFTIPLGYPAVFTNRVRYVLTHLTGNEKIDDISAKRLKEVIKYQNLIEREDWGLFKNNLGPINYRKLVEAISKLNMSLVDAKVSIDLKRILRLPSSLHSKVSMRCMEVQNLEKFDPLKKAVPKFVLERKEV